MNVKQFYRYVFVFLLSVFVFTGCGNSNSGGEFDGDGNPVGNSSQKITIKGVVVDDPIIGATVKVLSLSEEELKTATTDVNGSYTLEVSSDKISDGFSLEATGGQMNGVDFNETLRAIYGAGEDLEHANVTLLTSLVTKMAKDSIDGSGTLLDKRDEALQKLSDMGMLKKADWFGVEPSLVNMEELRAMVQGDGLDVWLDGMVADLSDNQLNRNQMGIFFKAHGGLYRAYMGNRVFVFPGETKKAFVGAETNSSGSDENVTLAFDGEAPEWVTIDKNALLIAPSESEEPLHTKTVNLKVTKDGVVMGRKVSVDILLMKKVVLVEGDLGTDGGTLYNEWKDISLKINQNILDQNHHVVLSAGMNENDTIIFDLKTEPEMSDYERSELKTTLPPTRILRNNYFSVPTNTTMSRSFIRDINYNHPCIKNEKTFDQEGYFFNKIWQVNSAYYYNRPYTPILDNVGIGGDPRLLRGQESSGYEQCSSRLWSTVSNDDTLLKGETVEPVLLVHGFKNSGHLGANDGEVYFGNFAKVLDSTNKFLPFEFEWRTNARFQDIAEELKEAIREIGDKTSKKVHVIAHSFGGILLRTLIQSDENKEFSEKYIATLTTVGTPHSGVSGGIGMTLDGTFSLYSNNEWHEIHMGNSISFPNGQDGEGNVIPACAAITCYQAGSKSGSSPMYSSKASYNFYGTVKPEGSAVYRMASKFNEYPDIPTQVLIGMAVNDIDCEKRTDSTCEMKYQLSSWTDSIGDYLISRKGQRVYPKQKKAYATGNIEEHILNFYNFNEDTFKRGVYDSVFDVLHGIEEEKDVSEGVYGFKVSKSLGNLYIKDYTLINIDKQTITHNEGEPDEWYSYVIKFKDKEQLKKFSLGYYHTTGAYKENTSTALSDNSTTGFNALEAKLKLTKQSEVGLQDCITAVGCQNSTWLYFKTFAGEHPSQVINQEPKIVMTGDVKYIGTNNQVVAKQTRSLNRSTSAVPFPVTVEAYTGSTLIATVSTNQRTTLKDDGTYELNVTYSPDTNYTVIAYPEGDTVARIGVFVRATASKFLTTFSTLEESTLHFPTITLTDGNYEEGTLNIKVTAGTSGTVLNGFKAEILNSTGVNVDEENTESINSGYTTIQPKGDYTVKISKEGYNSGEAQCTVKADETTECIVNIVSSAVIANGQITAVLSWGANPSDLDSHLVRKTNESQDYHVYYSNSTGEDANLDVDDTSSYGPETITISNLNQDSIYTYYVHNYSGGVGSVLPNSGAKVELNFDGTQRTFTIPNEEGQYWKVFEIDNGRIIPCTSGCVKDDTSTLIRKLDSESALFSNLPSKE